MIHDKLLQHELDIAFTGDGNEHDIVGDLQPEHVDSDAKVSDFELFLQFFQDSLCVGALVGLAFVDDLVRVMAGCPGILHGTPEVVLALRYAVQFVLVLEVMPVLAVTLWFEVPVGCTGQRQRILVDSVGGIPLLPLFDGGRSELVE